MSHRKVLFAVGLLALVAVVAAPAGGKKKKPTIPPPPPDLPGQVDYYARQLRGVPLDESEPITSKVQKLVLDHLQGWMASQAASGALRPAAGVATEVLVRRELEGVFSKLHAPFFGQPAVFSAAWKGVGLIGAGYTLGWSDYDRANVVALFVNREGQVRLAAVTNFVPRTDLHYEILPAQSNGGFQFFISGTRLGKSQLRLTAVLYSFDGENLKKLWETHDLYDGKMEVEPGRVTLRYLNEDEYIRETTRGHKPPRHEAIYKITPQGLELETDHEVPF